MIPHATRIFTFGSFVYAGLLSSLAPAQTVEDATVNAATTTLNEIMAIPAKQIPASLLAKARGIAIVPGVVKGGFVVGVRHGRGVLLTRNDDGTWKGPAFISLTGGSVGWQVGVQSTDVILVFRSRKSIDGLLRGKFTIGADAAVAAGPLGRKAAAATDASLTAEILSYSKSRGLFIGVSLDGTALEIDQAANASYYRPTVNADGQATQTIPASAYRLVNALTNYTTPAQVDATAAAAAPVATEVQRPGTAQPDPLRAELAQSSTALQGLLDENWRRYLALPQEIYGSGQVPVETLKTAAGRFDAVVRDVRYSVLTSRPEFTKTHQLLKRYLAEVKNKAQIRLPPPPSQRSSNPNLRLPL